MYLSLTKTKRFVIPAKEYVKLRFPASVMMYKDRWDKGNKRFKRIFSIYLDNDLDAFNALGKKIGEGVTVEFAWENARYNIQVR